MEVNSNTIEPTVHTSCYCNSNLLCVTIFLPIIIIANLTQPTLTVKQYLENEIQLCRTYLIFTLRQSGFGTQTQQDKKVVKLVFFNLHTD